MTAFNEITHESRNVIAEECLCCLFWIISLKTKYKRSLNILITLFHMHLCYRFVKSRKRRILRRKCFEQRPESASETEAAESSVIESTISIGMLFHRSSSGLYSSHSDVSDQDRSK